MAVIEKRLLVGLAVTLGLLTPRAEAAEFALIDVPADAAGPPLHGAMWSPCEQPPAEPGRGVGDCPISGENLPLVVIPHGHGGTFNGHQDTASALADAGFIVAANNHPGDTASDMSRPEDLAEIVERPVPRAVPGGTGATPAGTVHGRAGLQPRRFPQAAR